MLRFFATLLATGVGVLAATAWWSGGDPSETSPEPPSSKLERPAGESDGKPTRIVAPSAPELIAGPEKTRDLTDLMPTSPPARTSGEFPEVENDRQALVPVAAEPAGGSPRDIARSIPPIPAVPIPAPADRPSQRPAYVAIPIPAVPTPIPSPVTTTPVRTQSPKPRWVEVEETRIPEPAPFTEEFFEIAGSDDHGFYGEENVVFVEGDDDLEPNEAVELPGVASDGTDGFPADESRIAMNAGRDASADRIRRLLDVYETLRSRR